MNPNGIFRPEVSNDKHVERLYVEVRNALNV
jgi:hypothetical protein